MNIAKFLRTPFLSNTCGHCYFLQPLTPFFITLGEGYFVWVDVEGKKGLYLIFCRHEPEFKTLKKVRSNLNFLKF